MQIRRWQFPMLAAALWLWSAPVAAQTWAPKVLPNAAWANATAISDSGIVVGYSLIGSRYYGFVWTGRDPWPGGDDDRYIPTLGGIDSYAWAVNRAGQIAGSASTATSVHAFLLEHRSYEPKDLGTLGGTSSDGYGINNLGQVVGGSDITGDTAYHAFLY